MLIAIIAVEAWLAWLEKDSDRIIAERDREYKEKERKEEEEYRALVEKDDKLAVPKSFVRVHIGDNGSLINLAQISCVNRDRENTEKAEIVCSAGVRGGKLHYVTNETYEEVLALIEEAKKR